ncbi:MAG: HD-GYP domain-containing protein [Phycisphaerae bacterium]|nr:HD-GYP domain-containing protein [Phycisphaerae bacterium]
MSQQPGCAELATGLPVVAPGVFDARPLDVLGPLQRIDALCAENEILGRELLRCNDQLNLMFDITTHVAVLDDPERIEAGVLVRWGNTLNAAAVYVEHDGELVPLEVTTTTPIHALSEAELITGLMKNEIERCRAKHQTMHVSLSAERQAALGAADALLGALRRPDEPPRVAIALRAPNQPMFDGRDMLASESVLTYGGHILANVVMGRRLRNVGLETVSALAAAIDAKDQYTRGHSERVGFLASLVGSTLGMSGGQLQMLEWSGLLHDVGKIGIAESILNKRGRLTVDEYEVIKKHPRLSHEMLKPVAALTPVLSAVLHHHENHDGSGYPDGLAGDVIPLEARIIHVVDIFDALTSTRAYRSAYGLDRALGILADGMGSTTDPQITTAFVDAIRDYIEQRHADFQRRFGHLNDDQCHEVAAACDRTDRQGARP